MAIESDMRNPSIFIANILSECDIRNGFVFQFQRICRIADRSRAFRMDSQWRITHV